MADRLDAQIIRALTGKINEAALKQRLKDRSEDDSLSDASRAAAKAALIAVDAVDFSTKETAISSMASFDEDKVTIKNAKITAPPERIEYYFNEEKLSDNYGKDQAHGTSVVRKLLTAQGANMAEKVGNLSKQDREIIELGFRQALIKDAADDKEDWDGRTLFIGETRDASNSFNDLKSLTTTSVNPKDPNKTFLEAGIKFQETNVPGGKAQLPSWSETIAIQGILRTTKNATGQPYLAEPVDGIWGPATQEAVKAWAKANLDGNIFKDRDKDKLGVLIDIGTGTEAQVEKIQKFLVANGTPGKTTGLVQDKQFGPATQAAVKAFQEAYNKGQKTETNGFAIPTDGVWGPETMMASGIDF